MAYNGRKEKVEFSELFEKKIWRVDDVAKFLGFSKGTIYNLSSDEKIPKGKKAKDFISFLMKSLIGFWKEIKNEKEKIYFY